MTRDSPLRTEAASTWLTVLGTLALIAAMAMAREFLVPIAFAALLTFVMSPPVAWLERHIGRVPAVLGAVCVVFALLIGAGWVLVRELDAVARELPRYRTTFVSKVSQVRKLRDGGTVGELQKTIDSVQRDLAPPTREPRPARVVVAGQGADESPFGMLGPVLGLGASTGLVIALVIFMLLERRDLRDRIVGVIGHGHIVLTTRALDEAGARVARQLLMQTLVNAIYGVAAGTGLWLIGVPYPAVWASLGAVMRYVPYVGPVAAFVAPIVIAIAALEGWRGAMYVFGVMSVLELFTNLVLETVLYAGAAGVSQVGLLVAVTFWTWLWGPMGLVMAIPLTVCVVVVGKHVRGLEYLATLMADTAALAPGQAFYQRLLVRDMNDAADLIDRHLAAEGPRSLADALLLPALAQSGADLLQHRLDADGRQQMLTAIREMAIEAADPDALVASGDDVAPLPAPQVALSVLAYGVGGAADELALDLFSGAVADLPLAIDTLAGSATADVVAHVRAARPAVVCLADLSPVAAARTRHLVKRLRQALPDLDVVVGRWGGAGVAEEAQRLVEAGAAHVGASVDETRAWLLERLAQDTPGAVTTGRAPAAPPGVPPAPASAAAPRPRPAS